MKKYFSFSLLLLVISVTCGAQLPGYYSIYNDIAVSKQGKIVAVGTSDAFMITSLGTYYNGWTNGLGVAWQGEKFIAVGGKTGRFNPDGSIDLSFGTSGIVPGLSGTDVKVLCDNRILVAHGGITRLLSEGQTDLSFGFNGLATAGFPINKIAVQPDGKIIGISDHQIMRFTQDGSIDSSFSQGIIPESVGYFTEAAIQADGKIVVSASYVTDYINADIALLRFNIDGSLDKNFNGDGLVTLNINNRNDYGNSAAIQSDGKIIVAGTAHIFQCLCPAVGNSSMVVARYNTDGSLDTGFGEPTVLFIYNDIDPHYLSFDGIGKTVTGSFLQDKSMILYQDSIYLAGGTTNTSKEGQTFPNITTLKNDGFPLLTVNNVSFPAFIPDAYALNQGVLANTVYKGYAPASSVTLNAQTNDQTLSYTYLWNTGATSQSIMAAPAAPTWYEVTITNSFGCSVKVEKLINVLDVSCGNNNDKVQVCKSPKNSSKANSLCISAAAVPAQLKNGSMLGSCQGTVNVIAKTGKEESSNDNGMELLAQQNPSYSGFSLKVESTNVQSELVLAIYDREGRLIETRKVKPNSWFEVGNTFNAGIYYAVVVQGNQRKSLRLLKLK